MHATCTVLDDHVFLIWLEVHGPSEETFVGSGEVQDPLQCGVICDDFEGGTVDIGVQLLQSPNDSETFELGRSVVLLGRRQCTREEYYGVLLVLRVSLREDDAEARSRGVRVDDEWLGIVGVSENRRCNKLLLDLFHRLLLWFRPLPLRYFLQQIVEGSGDSGEVLHELSIVYS